MVQVEGSDVLAAYEKYVEIMSMLPPEITQKGCIVFASYIVHGVTCPQKSSHEWIFHMTPEMKTRMDNFLGPYGETIFKAWAIQQAYGRPE